MIGRVTHTATAGLVSLFLAGALVACASYTPERAVFVPVVAGEATAALLLSREVKATFADGVVYTLPEGSQWHRVGALVQGDVYRPLDASLPAGKPADAQAWLVASRGKLLGVYEPARSLYTPLPAPQVLPFSQRR
ncbi:MAG TPA: hypothetical protein DCR74_21990 [Achromobacter sp.]|uniref:hypothetical protein n=1 Tax=Achromobacter sp. TaxID=134375 RepID=UPI000EBFFE40|nr:hypothetical protein [Achromobacter sp.]HAP28220.1 hypothetical protein [Achromobacter sp.]